MAPRTRRQLHRVLSSALRRAVEDRMIARNPADTFRKRLPKVEKGEMKVLTLSSLVSSSMRSGIPLYIRRCS